MGEKVGSLNSVDRRIDCVSFMSFFQPAVDRLFLTYGMTREVKTGGASYERFEVELAALLSATKTI